MDAGVLFLLVSVLASLVPYFLPSLRRGDKIFAPFPGMVAIRFKVDPSVSKPNKYDVVLLDSFIVLTLIAMVFGYWFLLSALVPKGATRAAVVPLIPGITIPLSLMLILVWIIAAAIVAHEYSHYWACKKQGVPVKSAGVGWLLFFPIAFVEPDEEELLKRRVVEKLRVYAAGPAANLVLAGLALLILKQSVAPGVFVVQVEKGSPAWKAGIMPGDVIVKVNGVPVKSLEELGKLIRSSGPVVKLEVLRHGKLVDVVVYKGDKKLIGIFVVPWRPVGLFELLPPELVLPAFEFVVWTHMINLGLATINALPMFITDGGKMVLEARRRVGGLADAVQVGTLFLFIMVLTRSLQALR